MVNFNIFESIKCIFKFNLFNLLYFFSAESFSKALNIQILFNSQFVKVQVLHQHSSYLIYRIQVHLEYQLHQLFVN